VTSDFGEERRGEERRGEERRGEERRGDDGRPTTRSSLPGDRAILLCLFVNFGEERRAD
jgi:hypothetical protein